MLNNSQIYKHSTILKSKLKLTIQTEKQIQLSQPNELFKEN